ncbi:MAG TPA: hypothetical protein VGI95_02170 [Caulobacteraceae bacterium]|jgi:hypothetical protein
MTKVLTTSIATLIGAAALWGIAGVAQACDGAGVVIRIEGQPQDVQITRSEGGAASQVSRPRVLEVICHNDVVRTTGATYIVLSVDGAGTVRVDHNIAYTVPARSGAPTAIGNAYRSLNDQVLPDMKRLPWNVRLKGAGDDFGYALPALVSGGQKVQSGSRPLLVRLVGGTAPYRVEIRNAHGKVVAERTSQTHDVVLEHVTLADGDYKLTASDSTPRSLDATVTAVAAGPPLPTAFDGLADPEVRTAANATELARESTGIWSFEAEQELQAAPANGLDRDKVYELIESYGSE